MGKFVIIYFIHCRASFFRKEGSMQPRSFLAVIFVTILSGCAMPTIEQTKTSAAPRPVTINYSVLHKVDDTHPPSWHFYPLAVVFDRRDTSYSYAVVLADGTKLPVSGDFNGWWDRGEKFPISSVPEAYFFNVAWAGSGSTQKPVGFDGTQSFRLVDQVGVTLDVSGAKLSNLTFDASSSFLKPTQPAL